jgi:hypothetical protein
MQQVPTIEEQYSHILDKILMKTLTMSLESLEKLIKTGRKLT